MSNPIRLSSTLLREAEREGSVQKRSVPKQIEFWAELGKAIERVLGPADVLAVRQGLKRVRLETVDSIYVSSDDVFGELERTCLEGKLGGLVSESKIVYETSAEHPGELVQINRETGERVIGQFKDGEFLEKK